MIGENVMTTAKAFAIPFLLLTLSLWVYLLIDKRINGWMLSALLFASTLASALIYNFDYLETISLDLKNQKFLVELKRMRDDVFAKAETIKKMGEEIAKVHVFSVTSIGRWPPRDLDHKMLQAKGRIETFLQEIESSKEQIREITQPIDDMVVNDICNDCVELSRHTSGASKGNVVEISRDLRERIRKHLKDGTLAEYVSYLKAGDLYSDEIGKCIEKLKHFVATGELRDTH